MIMSFVSSIDGVEIYYEVLGEGDISLVFIGGWALPTALTVWKHQLLFSSKYKLVLVDLAGHGKSGKNRENYTLELFAHDVRSVVESLDLKNIILIGHSMGGPVILETEKLILERTIGLIAIDSLFLDSGSSYIRRENHIVKEIVKPLEEDFTGTVTAIFRSMLSDKFVPQDVEEIERTPHSLDKRSMISALIELQRWDLHNVLPQITRPIKCIVAGKSLSEENRADYDRIFNAAYLEDLGHLLFIEDPTRFNELLDDCITELLS